MPSNSRWSAVRRSTTSRCGPLMGAPREIRRHVEHDGQRMFGELRASFGREELVAMAAQVEAAEKIAPTRAHPLTPNEASIRALLGPVAGLLDHLRDAVN